VITIDRAENPAAIEQVRGLLLEYGRSIDFHLCFENFQRELDALPAPYFRPEGALFLAEDRGAPAGVAAFKKISPTVCEMKRLYVDSAQRGQGLGRALARRVIEEAQAAGYRTMLLDTLHSMTAAQALYRSLGFQETARNAETLDFALDLAP
jgi:putative acetyltransferase